MPLEAARRPEGARSTAAEQRPRGFLGLLADVFLAPTEAFREVARRPSFWAPLVALTLLQGGFAAVWLGRIDIVEFTRAQAIAAGREPPPAGAADEGVYGFLKTSIGVSMIVFTPLVALALAGVLMFVFNFVLGAESDYAQCLAVGGWSSLAAGLVSLPLTLLVMLLKGDWNLDPQDALATHVAAFLDEQDVPKALFTFAQSLDVISFWLIYLLSVGMSQVTRLRLGVSLAAVVGFWLGYVLLKVGLTSML